MAFGGRAQLSKSAFRCTNRIERHHLIHGAVFVTKTASMSRDLYAKGQVYVGRASTMLDWRDGF